MSAREMTWGLLQALPEQQQADYWRTIMARWQRNVECEADADFAFDHLPGRREVGR